jgi:hypothetical protein
VHRKPLKLGHVGTKVTYRFPKKTWFWKGFSWYVLVLVSPGFVVRLWNLRTTRVISGQTRGGRCCGLSTLRPPQNRNRRNCAEKDSAASPKPLRRCVYFHQHVCRGAHGFGVNTNTAVVSCISTHTHTTSLRGLGVGAQQRRPCADLVPRQQSVTHVPQQRGHGRLQGLQCVG